MTAPARMGSTLMVRNVVVATLTMFAPARSNGTAIIVAPGGAFHFLMMDHGRRQRRVLARAAGCDRLCAEIPPGPNTRQRCRDADFLQKLFDVLRRAPSS